VVAGLRHAGYVNVCVVNDGSADGTGALALRAGAHVLEHVTNFGQGAALQTGIDYALATARSTSARSTPTDSTRPNRSPRFSRRSTTTTRTLRWVRDS